MTIPAFLDTSFRYLSTPGVTDVQKIIDDLYDELVTGLGFACTQGGKTQSPTTYKSPDREDGVFYTIQLTRDSATQLSWVCLDQIGLQINNQGSTKQAIDGTGTEVRYFTGPFHVCVSCERTTPEAFAVGVMERSPEPLADPRPAYYASYGPRFSAGGLSTQTWMAVYIQAPGGAYGAGANPNNWSSARQPFVSIQRQSVSGALLFHPAEVQYSFVSYGRRFQALLVDGNAANGAEFNVPLDDTTVGVFKIPGFTAQNDTKIAYRKGTL